MLIWWWCKCAISLSMPFTLSCSSRFSISFSSCLSLWLPFLRPYFLFFTLHRLYVKWYWSIWCHLKWMRITFWEVNQIYVYHTFIHLCWGEFKLHMSRTSTMTRNEKYKWSMHCQNVARYNSNCKLCLKQSPTVYFSNGDIFYFNHLTIRVIDWLFR